MNVIALISNHSKCLSVELEALESLSLLKHLEGKLRKCGKMMFLDDTTCAVSAPTGLASFNTSGVIVHLLFHLPVEH